jgi:aldehyde dehydrogenase (NAD+)
MALSLLPMRDKLGVQPGQLLIDGHWQDGDSPRFEQVHPATQEVMATFPDASEAEVDRAVAAAREAFDNGPWPRMAAADRRRLLQPIIERIFAEEADLAALQTLDNGIPYHFSRSARVSPSAAARVFDHFAGWTDKITGETYPRFGSGAPMDYMTYREPVGVVAAILPFNGPVLTFAMKVAPALACGCTVVIKPSELTNLAVSRLARIIQESELPRGVINLVTGHGPAGAALAAHPGIDKVSFTGSTGVGEAIVRASGSNMKRLSLELGGKSAALVFPDTDIAATATTLMGLCSTFLSGQICSTPTRALVHRSALDAFLHHAGEQLKSVRFGDPFDPLTTSAPLASRRQMERVLDYVRIGREEGAQLLHGGDRPGGEWEAGNWVNPALFVVEDNAMRIAQEEIFGPVLTVIPFDTEEEAIRIANDSPFGLAGCVYTQDIKRALRVARSMRTGSVGINGYASSPHAPMGGVHRSGIGREGGWASIEAFTELKTVNFNMAD